MVAAFVAIAALATLGLFRLHEEENLLVFLPTSDPDVFTVGPGCRQSGEPAIFRRLADGRGATVYLGEVTRIRLDTVS